MDGFSSKAHNSAKGKTRRFSTFHYRRALGKTKPICIILDCPRRSDSWIPEDLLMGWLIKLSKVDDLQVVSVSLRPRNRLGVTTFGAGVSKTTVRK